MAGQPAVTHLLLWRGRCFEVIFHAGFKYGAVLAIARYFFCRNNGYAISTPSESKLRVMGIAYAASVMVLNTHSGCGNDVLAVICCYPRKARELACSRKLSGIN